MSSEWVETTWGDVATLEYGKAIRDYQNAKGEFPVYGTNGAIGWHHAPLCNSAGVVIGRKGAYRGIHYSKKPFFVIDTAFYLKPKTQVNMKWAYYCLLTYDINGMDSGSAIPSTSRDEFYKLPVRLPSLNEQERIAEVLSIFDDRIALLRETNATLEAIAQALFKSWFVDFDPVHAKQQGIAPVGLDEATAALFPDSFEESALGLVPKGWRVGTLGDIAATVRKQLQPSELHSELHYVGLEHIPRKSSSLSAWDNAEGLESAKASFDKGDILFGKLRPYFHKVVIAPFDGVCSTDILVCQPKAPAYYGLTAMHLFSTTLIDYADRLSNGAKMPRVNWKDLADYPICVPPETVGANYSETITPLVSRMVANVHQAQTLATLRDTLLPRLISGQLRLPEAEAMLEGT